jgi:alpha-glucosidase
MKKLSTFIIILLSSIVSAQVTIKITSIPSNTPSNSTIYLAGAVNNWSAGNAAYIMQPDGLGAFVITIPEGVGASEFKFTRGSWPTVEGNASGSYLP